MNDFKKDFEIRRIILGLTAIIQSQPLPGLVDQKIPDVMNQLTLLAVKMNNERQKILKENQEHVANGGKDSEDEDDEEVLEGEDIQEADGNDDFEDSDEEWKKQQKIFATVGSKLHTG